MKAKRKKVHRGNREDRFKEELLSQPFNQSGEKLETFCEHSDVGMNAITHWNDAHIEEIDVYSMNGWLEFEGYHCSIPFTSPVYKEIRLLPSLRPDAFNHMQRRVKADEKYLSFQNFYPGTDHFRYDRPEQDTRGSEEPNLVFSDVSNCGLGSLKGR